MKILWALLASVSSSVSRGSSSSSSSGSSSIGDGGSDGLDDIFGEIFSRVLPLILIPVAIVIVVSVVRVVLKNRKKTKVTFSNSTPSGNTTETTVYNCRPELSRKEYTYWQEDNQPIFERNKDQKDVLERYFIVKAKYKKNLGLLIATAICAGLGVISLILSSVADFFQYACLLLILAALVCWVVRQKLAKYVAPEDMYTDEQYEELVAKRIASKKLDKMSLEKLNLDPDQVKEIKPIILQNHTRDGYSLTRRDREYGGYLHSSTNYVVYLYFTNEQLHMFYYEFDMCCNVEEIDTREIFYTDICDVYTENVKNVIEFKKEKLSYESNDFNFYITTNNSRVELELDGTPENIQSLQALSQKIRERKYAHR